MWIDILILIFLAVFIADGWKDGFMRSLTALISWAAAAVCGVCFADPAKQFLESAIGLDMLISKIVSAENVDAVSAVLSFATVVIAVKIVIDVIAAVLKIVNKIPVLGILNRAAGSFLGAGKGIVILWLAVMLLMPYIDADSGGILAKACSDSVITSALCKYNPLLNIL